MLTTQETAKALKVSARRVLALISAGRLPATKFGPMYMVKPADLGKVRNRKPGRPRKSK